jgi:hypothetical protein
MRFAYAAALVVVMAACADSEGAPDTLVKASSDSVEVAPVLPPLDVLVARLDSARGFYWARTPRQLELTRASLNAELFRAHGKPAVQRLIDCMADTTQTTTYNADRMEYKYPRGILCYEALRAIADVDMSRQLRINMQDLFVSAELSQVRTKLRRAQDAWQVVHNANAYRLRTFTAE